MPPALNRLLVLSDTFVQEKNLKHLSAYIKYLLNLIGISVLLTACDNQHSGEYELMVVEDNWRMSRLGSNEKLLTDIPATVQEVLLLNDKIPDPYYGNEEENIKWMENESWEYSTWFKPENAWFDFDHLEMVFHGLDTYATVFLNGDTLFSSNNMFRKWTCDITEQVSSGRNELRIIFHPTIQEASREAQNSDFELPVVGHSDKVSVFCRKAPFHFGSNIGPRVIATGIWKPVEIVGWKDFKVENIDVQIDELNSTMAKLNVVFDLNSNDDRKLYVRLKKPESENNFRGYHLKKGYNQKQFEIEIENPILWWPRGYGNQHLYRLTFEFSTSPDFKYSKTETIITGLRKVELVEEQDEFGTTYFFRINDKPVHVKGVNYLPPGIFTGGDAQDKLNKIIDAAFDANANMIRVWGGGKYETDEFYIKCDSLGIMVWQDFMFANGFSQASKGFVDNVRSEVKEQLNRLQHHPSIMLWCGNDQIEQFGVEQNEYFNENYSYAQSSKIFRDYEVIFEELIPELIRQIDPEVPYISSSTKGRGIFGFEGFSHQWESAFDRISHSETPRFISAHGYASYPHFRVLSHYMDHSNISIDSEVMINRQKLKNANAIIQHQLENHYRSPVTFPGLIYYSQLLQAKYLSQSIEKFRLENKRCKGSVLWALNDSWPGISFGTLDFEGNWKAAHYTLRERYKPSVIIPIIKNNKLEIHLLSDEQKVNNVKVSVESKNFNGRILFKESSEITLIPDQPILVSNFSINGLVSGHSKARVFVKVRLSDDSGILDERIITFLGEKYLSLPQPNFQYSIERNDTINIDLSSDVFAKDVVLDFGEMKGHFSHNYFDMEPDTTYHLTFIPEEDQKLKTYLSIKSLVNF